VLIWVIFEHVPPEPAGDEALTKFTLVGALRDQTG
jgi:hypothetical protein